MGILQPAVICLLEMLGCVSSFLRRSQRIAAKTKQNKTKVRVDPGTVPCASHSHGTQGSWGFYAQPRSFPTVYRRKQPSQRGWQQKEEEDERPSTGLGPRQSSVLVIRLVVTGVLFFFFCACVDRAYVPLSLPRLLSVPLNACSEASERDKPGESWGQQRMGPNSVREMPRAPL